MNLNKWRYVCYIENDCGLYCCMKCQHTWVASEPPGYVQDGEYTPLWFYCPYCGTQWDGPHSLDPNNPKGLGPRRLRIAEAFNQPGVNFVYSYPWMWVLEKRETQSDGTPVSPWEEIKRYDPTWCSRDILFRYLQIAKDQYSSSKHGDSNIQIRVVTRKNNE